MCVCVHRVSIHQSPSSLLSISRDCLVWFVMRFDRKDRSESNLQMIPTPTAFFLRPSIIISVPLIRFSLRFCRPLSLPTYLSPSLAPSLPTSRSHPSILRPYLSSLIFISAPSFLSGGAGGDTEARCNWEGSVGGVVAGGVRRSRKVALVVWRRGRGGG